MASDALQHKATNAIPAPAPVPVPVSTLCNTTNTMQKDAEAKHVDDKIDLQGKVTTLRRELLAATMMLESEERANKAVAPWINSEWHSSLSRMKAVFADAAAAQLKSYGESTPLKYTPSILKKAGRRPFALAIMEHAPLVKYSDRATVNEHVHRTWPKEMIRMQPGAQLFLDNYFIHSGRLPRGLVRSWHGARWREDLSTSSIQNCAMYEKVDRVRTDDKFPSIKGQNATRQQQTHTNCRGGATLHLKPKATRASFNTNKSMPVAKDDPKTLTHMFL